MRHEYFILPQHRGKTLAWLAAVDYRQGTLHRAHHQPCQDFGLVVKPTAGCVIGALADGDGEARLSHIGAQSAVKAATAALSDSAIDHTDTDGSDLETALQAVRDALLQEAAGRACPVEDLATSLLAFVLTEGRIAALRVGDGFLISGAPSQPYRTVGQASLESAGAVSVTDPDAEAEITILDGPVTFVAAGTEGLQELTIRPEDGRPYSSFLRPLNSYLTAAESDDEIHLGIREFLRSDRLAEHVEDDVTLLLCGWRADRPQESLAL